MITVRVDAEGVTRALAGLAEAARDLGTCTRRLLRLHAGAPKTSGGREGFALVRHESPHPPAPVPQVGG